MVFTIGIKKKIVSIVHPVVSIVVKKRENYSVLALGCPVSFARHCEACSEANDEATQKSHDIAGLLRRSLRYTPRNDEVF